MKKIAVYAGSFDPFTFGHLEVLNASIGLFDEVIVVIAENPAKKRFTDVEKMKMAMTDILHWLDPACPTATQCICKVEIWRGLTIDLCAKHKATHLVRGLRDGVDYGMEERLAKINKEIANIDTVYFRSDQFGYVSSSMVRELLHHGKDVSKYVPLPVLNCLTGR